MRRSVMGRLLLIWEMTAVATPTGQLPNQIQYYSLSLTSTQVIDKCIYTADSSSTTMNTAIIIPKVLE